MSLKSFDPRCPTLPDSPSPLMTSQPSLSISAGDFTPKRNVFADLESAMRDELMYEMQKLDPGGQLKNIALEVDRQAGVVSAGKGLDLGATGQAGLALSQALSQIIPSPHLIHECLELFKMIWRWISGKHKHEVSRMADGTKVYSATLSGQKIIEFSVHELQASILRKKMHLIQLSLQAIKTQELDTLQRIAEACGADVKQEVSHCIAALRQAARSRRGLKRASLGGGDASGDAATVQTANKRRLNDKGHGRNLFLNDKDA